MPKGTTSPRRLSRARQPPPPSHTNSVSSNSSNRAERNTRSNQKASSPQKSSTPQSFTSEDAGEEAGVAPRGGTSEPPQLRRSKRQHDNDDDGDTKTEDAIEDEIVDDEETTRCICGFQEYPGRPADPTLGRSARGPHGSSQDDQTDDLGGLFIQCDDCQVWQHGGCVSIMEESAVPDNYYCEQCKPELHELLKATDGQKFSHYLPVWSKSHPKSLRKGSVEKDDKAKLLKEKERVTRPPETKRRATMNSRAAYDEDEVLRKVLEESKNEGQPSAENGSRKGKRNRDDSEDVRSETKRQRTASSVLSSRSGDDSGAESDQDKNGKKSTKGAAVKGGTKVDKLTAAEPVVKRRGGRRNGGDVVVEPPSLADGTEAESSAAPSARASAKASPAADADTPETPNLLPNSATSAVASTSKRGGKRPGAGRGRSNPAPPTPSEKDEKESPRNGNEGGNTPIPSVMINGATSKRGKRGHQPKDHDSGDSDKDAIAASSTNGNAAPTGSDADIAADSHSNSHVQSSNGSGSKKKEPSMNELKRRAAAMLDWVERAKEDLGKNSIVAPSSSGMSPLGAGSMSPLGAGVNPIIKSELGSVADMLQSRLLGWQVEYGT
ncbi:hypothetical protein, variant [Verruconis gallopava]|uniref:Zinc finger PHD-type domain-containing protein n=1 Tax=Verruconis gallopava TaxID=253628 RepID=A0A0D1XPX6_9PEZI|nr:hypothetical protein, variant [Verruconis gallopava]KIW04611.1 hypothetical protein, variant [Verruconis gallopava]